MHVVFAAAIAVLLYSPLVAFSIIRSKAIKEKERIWQYVVRALLPLVTFVLMNLILVIVDTLVFPNAKSVSEQELPELVTNLIGAVVFFLLCLDNIRCKSIINKVLGVLYMILGIGLILVALAQ